MPYSQIKEDDYSMSMIPRISPLPMDYSDYFCHETLSESGNSEENVGDFCQRPEPEYEDGPNSPSISSAIGKGGVIGAPLAPPDFSIYRSHLSQLCASKRPSTAKCTPMFSGLPPALLKRLKNKTTLKTIQKTKNQNS